MSRPPPRTPAMRLLLLSVLAFPACTTTPDSGADDDTAEPAVDADGDGSPAGDDCDDADDAVHPGADDPCDGADQDCDGVDGDPDAPQALLVQGDGAGEDVSDSLANAVNLDVREPSTLYVCGGTWDPWLLVDADLTIQASDAEFLSTSLTADGADVTVEGGAWSGALTFNGTGTASVHAELVDAQLSARTGYQLTVHDTELPGGAISAQGGSVTLVGVTIGGSEALAVSASDGGALTLQDVVITNTFDGNVVRVDDGTLTVEGLTLADTPATLYVVGSTATLTGLDVSGGSYPLSFAGSVVTLTDSRFEGNEGAIANAGTLVVEDCEFVGTHKGASIAASGPLTVRRSSFTGATTEGTVSPYEISFDVEALDRELIIESSAFADPQSGGAAVFTNGPTTVSDTTFTNMGTSQVAIVGAYLNTPFTSDVLDGRVRFERVTIDGASVRPFEGTLCPTLVDTVASGVDAEFARFRSWDEASIRCTAFGDGLEVTGGAGVTFETPAEFGCTDCTFTDLAADHLYTAPSGTVSFVGGALAANRVYLNGISLGAGTVTLDGVDLGTGAGQNVGSDGSTTEDVRIGATGWDGDGVVSVVCDEAGCDPA